MDRDGMPRYGAAVAEVAELPTKGAITLESGLGTAGGSLLVSMKSADGDIAMGVGSPGSSSSWTPPGSSGGFGFGFGMSSTSPIEPALPAFTEFVKCMSGPQALYEPQKTLSFLDGGNDKGGVIEAFRRRRAEYLRSVSPGRSASSISGSAFVDGRYFARQLYLPLIVGCMEGINSIEDYVLQLFDPETVAKVRDCRIVLKQGGVMELQRRIEMASEHESEKVRLRVVAEKTVEMEAAAGGQPLSRAARKKIRDAGSSCKSNEKRKRCYEHTKNKLVEMLELRTEVYMKMVEFFNKDNMPRLDADQQVHPPGVA